MIRCCFKHNWLALAPCNHLCPAVRCNVCRLACLSTPVARMACSMLRTKCFAGASTARAAQPTRAVRMVVRASTQQQPKQLPAIVKPAIVSASTKSCRTLVTLISFEFLGCTYEDLYSQAVASAVHDQLRSLALTHLCSVSGNLLLVYLTTTTSKCSIVLNMHILFVPNASRSQWASAAACSCWLTGKLLL